MEASVPEPKEKAESEGGEGCPDFRALLEEQRARFARQAARLGHAFRRTGEALEREDREAGRYARWIGDQAERLSGYLRESHVEDLAKRARGLATRNNLLLVGGAAAAGYLCYRLFARSRKPEVAEEAES
ncbi:MAG: hypothetical protein HY900_04950 [Deltaproteobacteria bacterium]|nr:hypothetical protein [Deltaproteobacteria bacterium]